MLIQFNCHVGDIYVVPFFILQFIIQLLNCSSASDSSSTLAAWAPITLLQWSCFDTGSQLVICITRLCAVLIIVVHVH